MPMEAKVGKKRALETEKGEFFFASRWWFQFIKLINSVFLMQMVFSISSYLVKLCFLEAYVACFFLYLILDDTIDIFESVPILTDDLHNWVLCFFMTTFVLCDAKHNLVLYFCKTHTLSPFLIFCYFFFGGILSSKIIS